VTSEDFVSVVLVLCAAAMMRLWYSFVFHTNRAARIRRDAAAGAGAESAPVSGAMGRSPGACDIQDASRESAAQPPSKPVWKGGRS
jgi:hypothetical protein